MPSDNRRHIVGPADLVRAALQLLHDADDGFVYISIEGLYRLAGTRGNTALMRDLWNKGGHGRRVRATLRNRFDVDVVAVTKTVTEATDRSDPALVAGISMRGQDGRLPMVGLYFPNGEVDDPIIQLHDMARGMSAGGALGNSLATKSRRLEEGLLTPSAARASLAAFEQKVIHKTPERAVLIQKHIPRISKRVGGQYPLGIEAAPRGRAA